LHFHIQRKNVTGEDAKRFLVELHRAIRRPLLVVWDRWNVHRKAARIYKERFGARIHFEWLPAYAPELNPEEAVWNRTKYGDLSNFIPDDIDHLEAEVVRSLRKSRTLSSRLRSFFRRTGLKL